MEVKYLMAFSKNLSPCHFQRQNTERDGSYVWEQYGISVFFYSETKLVLNYFGGFFKLKKS